MTQTLPWITNVGIIGLQLACEHAKSFQSCALVTHVLPDSIWPWDSSRGRILEWVVSPSPGSSPTQDRTPSSYVVWQVGSYHLHHLGNPQQNVLHLNLFLTNVDDSSTVKSYEVVVNEDSTSFNHSWLSNTLYAPCIIVNSPSCSFLFSFLSITDLQYCI